MRSVDIDADLEHLVRCWHSTNELCTAAWAEFLALGDALPPGSPRVTLAGALWRAAEAERSRLMMEIERLEAAEAA